MMFLVELVDDAGLSAWLLDVSDSRGWCGYDATGSWPASTWILHAMYERDDLPGGMSHDDVYRMESAVPPASGALDREQ